MIEKEIAESIIVGKEVTAKPDDIHKAYQDNLNSVIDGLKNGEFVINTPMCGITGKPCEHGGDCSICIVALSAFTNTAVEMEEKEQDLIKFKKKNDKAAGITYMTTPSEVISRFSNKAQMMAKLDINPEDLVETEDEDMKAMIGSLLSIYQSVLSHISSVSSKKYIVTSKNMLVFEIDGGALIVFKIM